MKLRNEAPVERADEKARWVEREEYRALLRDGSIRTPSLLAGIEARGFILGGAVAHQVSAGFVPIRKKGKLPHETVRVA